MTVAPSGAEESSSVSPRDARVDQARARVGQARARVGVSSCLLGVEVRYDGGHKQDPYVSDTLARHFELVPVCPEVAIGLGVPREPIRLVRARGEVRVVGVATRSLDVTRALADYGRETASRLGDLSGYVFKRGSPSCGIDGVPIHNESGEPVTTGSGAFARILMCELPLLPVEDEGRLCEPEHCESFIVCVGVYQRWQGLLSALTPDRLAAFHAAHERLLHERDPGACRRLSALATAADTTCVHEIASRYGSALMKALRRR